MLEAGFDLFDSAEFRRQGYGGGLGEEVPPRFLSGGRFRLVEARGPVGVA